MAVAKTRPGPPPLSCSIADQQDWLHSYMDDWYFWYALAPNPSPTGFATVADYFDALIYGGGDPIPVAAARCGRSTATATTRATESFNRFFGDGQTLGYGVAVAGLEVTDADAGAHAAAVRALHRAAVAGGGGRRRARRPRDVDQRRRRASSLISANDFSALTPNAAGDR